MGKCGKQERNSHNQENASNFDIMDSNPGSREDRMARWAIDGSRKQWVLLEKVGLLLRPARGSTEEQNGGLKQREVLPGFAIWKKSEIVTK